MSAKLCFSTQPLSNHDLVEVSSPALSQQFLRTGSSPTALAPTSSGPSPFALPRRSPPHCWPVVGLLPKAPQLAPEGWPPGRAQLLPHCCALAGAEAAKPKLGASSGLHAQAEGITGGGSDAEPKGPPKAPPNAPPNGAQAAPKRLGELPAPLPPAAPPIAGAGATLTLVWGGAPKERQRPPTSAVAPDGLFRSGGMAELRLGAKWSEPPMLPTPTPLWGDGLGSTELAAL